jgi:mono/diheme cytochrome c family protein
MDFRTLAASSLVVLVLVGATAGVAQNGRAAAKGGAPASRVERGRHLATIMGCNDCHTPGTLYGAPDFGRALSGSDLGWKGPWGVTYARNLTPHVETGIGRWSEQQIVTALRTGHRPDGTALLPPMPWPNAAQLSDEDAFALAAYLKSLPPVAHHVPDRVPPGKPVAGACLELPAPPAWDAPRAAPGGGSVGGGRSK